ncbi:MAG: DsbA family protein, partial [Litorivicinus sp.]
DEAAFNAQWRSFGVESRLKQTESRITAYGINGVPAFIVNGKYRVTETTAGGQAALFDVINYLIEKEKAQM